VPPTRSLRSGPTLEAVRAAVRAEFGPGARIVSAERVTTPGIGGLFKRAHVEAVVEVPDPGTPVTARVAIADTPVTRVGIAALLAEADETEARIARADGTATARADAFASVLDGFVADGIAPRAPRPTADPPEAGRVDGAGSRLQDGSDWRDAADLADGRDRGDGGDRRDGRDRRPGGAGAVVASAAVDGVLGAALVGASLPAVRSADGDLVLLVGRAGDVDAAAGVFAARYALRATPAADRRSGILARADGVRQGHALLGVAAWDDAATVAGLAPDQVWVVVDVGRKHEDTVAMVAAVASRTPVAGIVAIGAGETATPESVHRLGVPVLSLG